MDFMSMEVLQKHFYFQKRNEITLLKRLSRQMQDEKKVICHVGAISTDQAIGYAKNAEKCGADAVSAISPFYYKF